MDDQLSLSSPPPLSLNCFTIECQWLHWNPYLFCLREGWMGYTSRLWSHIIIGALISVSLTKPWCLPSPISLKAWVIVGGPPSCYLSSLPSNLGNSWKIFHLTVDRNWTQNSVLGPLPSPHLETLIHLEWMVQRIYNVHFRSLKLWSIWNEWSKEYIMLILG